MKAGEPSVVASRRNGTFVIVSVSAETTGGSTTVTGGSAISNDAANVANRKAQILNAFMDTCFLAYLT